MLHLEADGQEFRVVLGRDKVVWEGERMPLSLSMDKFHLFGQDGKWIEL